jgi:LmbE family N-acetylglucosaminyl deacetylase
MRWCLALVGVAFAATACGDNIRLPDGAPLTASDRVVIVAHQDDDLLFMQPDLRDVIESGEAVTIVYVTQGITSESAGSIEARLRGSQTAYRDIAGSDLWSCGWIELGSLPVLHCRLADRPLSLVFLGMPDGGKHGENHDSELHLWEDATESTWTIGARTARVDRETLIATVAELLARTSPHEIMTLDPTFLHGRDHSDHTLVGALAFVAAARAHVLGAFVMYRGYNVDKEPVNKLERLVAQNERVLGFYWSCYASCGECGRTSCPKLYPEHKDYLHRRYSSARRLPPLSGQLALGGACAGIAGDAFAMTDCASAPIWQLATDATLRAPDGRCATVTGEGAVALAPCDGSPGQALLLDDEGRLWSALPPATATEHDHLLCLTDQGAALCGPDSQRDVRWALMRPSVTSDLAALGMGPGQQLVIRGHDLCAASTFGMLCALGHGDGTFEQSQFVNGLAIYPPSLRTGDIDGDGLPDACGFDEFGEFITCVVAADGMTTPRVWLFLDRAADLDWLALVPARKGRPAQLCTRDPSGVTCHASTGSTFADPVGVPGAPATGPLWVSDLDNDGRPDWCMADASGPSCALAARQILGGGALPWSFALAGTLEGSLASDGAILDPTRAVLGDVDGDGLPDLCRITSAGVECATNQREGFGPSHVVAPAGDTLLLGDLDGDGRADICTQTGTSLTCTLSP